MKLEFHAFQGLNSLYWGWSLTLHMESLSWVYNLRHEAKLQLLRKVRHPSGGFKLNLVVFSKIFLNVQPYMEKRIHIEEHILKQAS